MPYIFTLNNYTDENIHQLKELNLKYLVIGYEIAPKTKTPHLQGYLEFLNHPPCIKCKLTDISNIWYRKRRGTHEQASDYCKKGGVYDEYDQEWFELKYYRQCLQENRDSAQVPIIWYTQPNFDRTNLTQFYELIALEKTRFKFCLGPDYVINPRKD